MALMSELPSNYIDLTITSPPYNLGEKHHTGNKKFDAYDEYKDNLPENEYQQIQIKVLNEIFRVTKEGGSLMYNHKNRIKDGKQITPYEWLLKTDWTIKQEIVWFNGSQNFDKCRFYPMTERIFWLSKGIKTNFVNTINQHDLLKDTPEGTDKEHKRAFPLKYEKNDGYADGGTIIQKGNRVRIVNTQYDGKEGLVVSNDLENGNYQVQVDGEVKGFPFENLMLLNRNTYANGGMFDDNDGFMKSKNGNNYRLPQKQVFKDAIDEPIKLVDNVGAFKKKATVESLNDKINLDDDKNIRARLGYVNDNRNADKLRAVNPRMTLTDLPKVSPKNHKKA